MLVYIVVTKDGVLKAAFADPDDAQNYIDHGVHLGDTEAASACVVRLELYYGQHLWQRKNQ